MALALNNLKRVDIPLNKETTPNHFKELLDVQSTPLLLLLHGSLNLSSSLINVLNWSV